jgi:hypothetical protein
VSAALQYRDKAAQPRAGTMRCPGSGPWSARPTGSPPEADCPDRRRRGGIARWIIRHRMQFLYLLLTLSELNRHTEKRAGFRSITTYGAGTLCNHHAGTPGVAVFSQVPLISVGNSGICPRDTDTVLNHGNGLQLRPPGATATVISAREHNIVMINRGRRTPSS